MIRPEELRQFLKEAAPFRKRHLFVVEQAHRSQEQDQAAGRQDGRQNLPQQAYQLVAGKGAGYPYLRQGLPARQAQGPDLRTRA